MPRPILIARGGGSGIVGRVRGLACFFLFFCVALLLRAGPLRADPIIGTDVDGRKETLNAAGRVGVVMSSSPDTDGETRDAGRVLDSFRGRADFQLFIVVDLRNSIAGVMPPLVRGEVRKNLDAEARRLKPFYLANGNTANPRNSQEVFPDFTGVLCRPLGWAATPLKLRVVVYGLDGNELIRWDDLKDYNALRQAVEGALGTVPAAAAPPAVETPAPEQRQSGFLN